jgi:hypothetical protein
MALITAISLFVVSVLTAAVSRIVAEEIGEWIPSIIRGLIKLAVAWLPDTQRERFGEEWQSHVNEVPGRLGKLAFAAGLLIAARKMALSARHDQSVDQRLQRLALMDDVLSKAAAVSTAIHSDTQLASREELSAHLGQLDTHLGRLNLLRAKLATGVAKAAARPGVTC